MSPRSTIDHRAGIVGRGARARGARRRRGREWFPAVVRRRARWLPVRHGLRRVRRRLPVRGLAATPADGDVEPARMGGVPRQRQGAATPSRCPALVGLEPPRPDVHPPALAVTVARPPAGVLGLHPRRAGHLPADARPAALRARRPDTADRYQVYVGARRHRCSFDADSIVGWIIFHALDIAAVLVLAGVFIFLRRRLRDPGALAVERSSDFLAARRAVRRVGDRPRS